jgi:holliday junction DNA helicase RuvA
MIGYLAGVVQWSELDAVCVVVNGVGYRLLMTLPDLSKCATPGTKVELYVHTHVREDAIVLFGFSTRAGLSLFDRLIGVSGVGPRTALALLSGLDVDTLVRSIAEGDEARLTRVPGVGKKTAAHIILDLKDKLAKESLGATSKLGTGGKTGALDDVRSALANLGYKTPQIDRALQKVKALADGGASLSDVVREALKHVS